MVPGKSSASDSPDSTSLQTSTTSFLAPAVADLSVLDNVLHRVIDNNGSLEVVVIHVD